MKLYTGISNTTPQNLLLDTGAFFVNFDINTDTYDNAKEKMLGATSGGGKFIFKPNYRIPKVDGQKVPIKKNRFIESWEISMGASMLEFKKDVFMMALGASKSSSVTINTKNYTKIEGKNVLDDTDYLDNITWVGTISGTNEPIIIQVFNALNDEGLNFEPKDNDDIVCDLNFIGHSTTDNLDTPPYVIYYPETTTA